MSPRFRLLRPVLAVTALLALSGCVAYPAGGYYGAPYGDPVYAPGPTVVVPIAPYYYGGSYGGYRGGYGGYRGGYGHGH